MSGANAGRKMTPKGQMSSSNSGPAIMMMPPVIRETFMPDPPLRHLPPPSTQRRKTKIYVDLPDTYEDYEDGEEKEEAKIQSWPKCKMAISGIAAYMQHFDRGGTKKAPKPSLSKSRKQILADRLAKYEQEVLEPLRQEYRIQQQDSKGEFMGMNCFKTLFVGRLAYEVTERKLLREMEAFGPIKDIRLVFPKDTESYELVEQKDKDMKHAKKSRGYAFIEYEHEEDMKRAYRAADGMRLEGRDIVVDVERGHTVRNWLPRRLGGGLGGTRLGSRDVNVAYPGRFDPTKIQGGPSSLPMAPFPNGPGGRMMMMPPPPPPAYGGGPPYHNAPQFHDRSSGIGGGGGRGPYDDRTGPPPRRYDDRSYERDYGGGPSRSGDSRQMKRGRSPSPPHSMRSRDSRRTRY